MPTFTGSALNTDVVRDPIFGTAFECSQEMQSQIVLDTVPYAETGAFSVNLWFQVNASIGDLVSSFVFLM